MCCKKSIVMKKREGILEQIEKKELDRMAAEIKETLASGVTGQHKTFSHVDLWNIQRHHRSAQSRRNYLVTGN